MTSIFRSIILATLFFCGTALALDLDQAKDAGLVGEKDTGYLGAVVERPDVLALIADINAKRKVKYTQLAEKNNITLEQVEKLAAQKAYQKTQSGHYLYVDGKWLEK